MKAPKWLLRRLENWGLDILGFSVQGDETVSKNCDEIVRPDYLYRWYAIPKNRFFNIYLHLFVGDDDDRAPHDHPWPSLSIALQGTMLEHMDGEEIRIIKKGDIIFRSATHRHRQTMVSNEAITLFITGPKYRKWGFWPDGKFVYWKDFIDPRGNS